MTEKEISAIINDILKDDEPSVRSMADLEDIAKILKNNQNNTHIAQCGLILFEHMKIKLDRTQRALQKVYKS
jgi:hypothetical protein